MNKFKFFKRCKEPVQCQIIYSTLESENSNMQTQEMKKLANNKAPTLACALLTTLTLMISTHLYTVHQSNINPIKKKKQHLYQNLNQDPSNLKSIASIIHLSSHIDIGPVLYRT